MPKSQQQARGGYFLIFFALVLTILTLPLLGTVLSQTIDVQENIAKFRDATFARTSGDSLLNAAMRRDKANGLGYMNIGSYPETAEEGDLTINYFFNSASVFPVPTNSEFIEPFGPEAKFPVVGSDGEPAISTIAGRCADNEYLNLAYQCEDVAEFEKFYYTVPALGTGNAGEDCSYNRLNLDKTYPSSTSTDGTTDAPEYVDPLDDPCNWNTLALGETVGIPLYYKYKDASGEIVTQQYTPETLKLRVRLACADGEAYCPNEDRLVFEDTVDDPRLVSGEDEDVDGDGEDRDGLDDSERVFSWIVSDNVTGNVYSADNRWFSDQRPGREWYNSEFTVHRLSIDPAIDGLALEIPRFYFFGGVSYVNYLSLPLRYFADAFSSDVLDFDSDQLLSSFVYPESNELFLTLEFLNSPYHASDGSRVRYVEYQLLSDVPVGNTDFYAVGNATNVEGEYYVLNEAKIGGPEVSSPGLVFGN